MVGLSVLFQSPLDCANALEPLSQEAFRDLNLDQIIPAITSGWAPYELTAFFSRPLHRLDAIAYRQEVMRDLENPELFEKITLFASGIRSMRDHLALAEKLHCQNQQSAWRLDAVAVYCDAVAGLVSSLSESALRSRALMAFRDYLRAYAASAPFSALVSETSELKRNLASVRYCVLIKTGALEVRRYEGESDYSAEVEQTFEKFRQGAAKDYKTKYDEYPDMSQLEEKILDFVTRLYPEIFNRLNDYCSRRSHFVDETVAIFDREVHFYVAWLEYAAKFKRAGLYFCYPNLSDDDKSIHNFQGFDLALAGNLLKDNEPVVCNDFQMKGGERVIVVTGPNQGGKTTFARMVGQLHFFASLGCPVPGVEARLFLFDRLFTHFEREEKADSLRGKLQDDLLRIHAILERATPDSLVIMNEIFTSTTLQDALFLSGKVMETIASLDLLCVWVTFIDELASFNEKTVSMASTVVPDNPSLRTFKIVRKPADGLSYAISIAEKYRLTCRCLRERLAR